MKKIILITLLLLVPIAGVTGQQITVGPSIHVSTANPTKLHGEYRVAADPARPGHLMVCSAGDLNYVYVSFNGGKRWEFKKIEKSYKGAPTGMESGCEFGLNGMAFYSNFAGRWRKVGLPTEPWMTWQGDDTYANAFYRSTDGGSSWGSPLLMPGWDLDKMMVDQSSELYHGRVYFYGMAVFGPSGKKSYWMLYSTDSGRTFQRSERLPLDDNWAQFGSGTVLSDGTLMLPIDNCKGRTEKSLRKGECEISVIKSIDGGLHLAKIEKDIPIIDSPERPDLRSGWTFTEMASDHSRGPFRGRAYLLWGQRFVDAGDSTRSHDNCTLMLSFSDDQGKTWSTPVRVSDERGRGPTLRGPDLTKAAITVNPAGVVGVTWYDTREDPKNADKRMRFSASLDGGESWLPSVWVATHTFRAFKDVPRGQVKATTGQINTKMLTGALTAGETEDAAKVLSITIRPVEETDKWQTFGDYAGLAADADGTFHAVWIDNRNGVGQIYTAPVTVTGTVKRTDAALNGLKDVTAQLKLEVTSTSSEWKGNTQLVMLEYKVTNIGSDTIIGPLKLRVTKLESDFGATALRLGGNHRGGVGTIIDLAMPGQQLLLAPGQSLPAERIQIEVGPIGQDVIYSLGSATARFDAKMYGRVRGG